MSSSAPRRGPLVEPLEVARAEAVPRRISSEALVIGCVERGAFEGTRPRVASVLGPPTVRDVAAHAPLRSPLPEASRAPSKRDSGARRGMRDVLCWSFEGSTRAVALPRVGGAALRSKRPLAGHRARALRGRSSVARPTIPDGPTSAPRAAQLKRSCESGVPNRSGSRSPHSRYSPREAWQPDPRRRGPTSKGWALPQDGTPGSTRVVESELFAESSMRESRSSDPHARLENAVARRLLRDPLNRAQSATLGGLSREKQSNRIHRIVGSRGRSDARWNRAYGAVERQRGRPRRGHWVHARGAALEGPGARRPLPLGRELILRGRHGRAEPTSTTTAVPRPPPMRASSARLRTR
jgi:hypothetical protein